MLPFVLLDECRWEGEDEIEYFWKWVSITGQRKAELHSQKQREITGS